MKIKNFIMSWPACLVIATVILIVGLVPKAGQEIAYSFTEIEQRTCVPLSVGRETFFNMLDGPIYLNLDCDGKKSKIHTNDFATLTYLASRRGSLYCTLYKSGYATCKIVAAK